MTEKFQMIKIKKIGKKKKLLARIGYRDNKNIVAIRSLSKMDSNLLRVGIGEPHRRHIMIIRSKNAIIISIFLQNCNCGGARKFIFDIFL
jgi:hypothetical protein